MRSILNEHNFATKLLFVSQEKQQKYELSRKKESIKASTFGIIQYLVRRVRQMSKVLTCLQMFFSQSTVSRL